MSRAGIAKCAAVIVTVIWVCLEAWAVGPVMRESDQASLLEGAVELARGETAAADNNSYNYDKQYLSYWVVAAWLKLRGVVDGGNSSLVVVREGNLLAVTLLSLALIGAVGSQRKWSAGQVAVLYCALFSPVLVFSGLFLSPNMISAAFLLTLAIMLRRPAPREDSGGTPPSVVRVGLVAIMAWAATAARQDAILLMPLLAVLAAPRASLGAVVWNRQTGALLGGCLVAIAGGYALSADYAEMPSPFFVLPTFVAFLGGGLGALLLLLLVFVLKVGLCWSLGRIMLVAAVLLPLLFYACVLYTPRHLYLTAFALLLTVLSDRGREAWDLVTSSRLGRVGMVCSILATLVLWTAGVRMSGWKSGQPVLTAPTLFPSTDGFWPMGGYGWFFNRLVHGAERPVDHNQEVWRAWSAVDVSELPAGRGMVLSSGLVSYGTFHLSWGGVEQTSDLEQADYVLFDERTLGKRQRGVNSTEGGNRARLLELLDRGEISVVGEGLGQRILLFTPGKRGDTEMGVSVKLALHQVFGGNDFRVARWDHAKWDVPELVGHRGVVASRSRELVERFRSERLQTEKIVRAVSDYDQNPWWTVTITISDWDALRKHSGEGFDDLWVAFGTLPAFMDVRNYGARKPR